MKRLLAALGALVAALVIMAASCNPPPPNLAGWNDLAGCETNGNWSAAYSAGGVWYYGGLSLSDKVWKQFGGTTAHANQADKPTQITVADRLLKAYSGQGQRYWTRCWPLLWP